MKDKFKNFIENNKKVITTVISILVIVITAVIANNIYINNYYYTMGKESVSGDLENYGYTEKIKYLLFTLNDTENDGGLNKVYIAEKGEYISLNKNRKYFDCYRKGMIEGLKEELIKEKEKGLNQIIEDEVELTTEEDREIYNKVVNPILDKYSEEFINTIEEYEDLLVLIQEDFEDGDLDSNYEYKLDKIDDRFNELGMDLMIDLMDEMYQYEYYEWY